MEELGTRVSLESWSSTQLSYWKSGGASLGPLIRLTAAEQQARPFRLRPAATPPHSLPRTAASRPTLPYKEPPASFRVGPAPSSLLS